LTSAVACIGVLITIPDPVGAQLSSWRRRFVEPTPAGVPAHITLLPPTLVPTDRLDEVERHLHDVVTRIGPFGVHLRGSGTFRPVSPVTFVQVATGIGPCELLEAQVRSGPLARPLQYPYHPHVTVAQNVDPAVLDRVDADLARFDARFDVCSVDLYEARPAPGTTRTDAHADGDGADARQVSGPWSLRTVFALSAQPDPVPARLPVSRRRPAVRPAERAAPSGA